MRGPKLHLYPKEEVLRFDGFEIKLPIQFWIKVDKWLKYSPNEQKEIDDGGEDL